MVNAIKIGLGIIAAVTLAVVGLGAGWLFWGRWLWQPGLIGGPGMMWNADDCNGVGGGPQSGLFGQMMGPLNVPFANSGPAQGRGGLDAETCSDEVIAPRSPAQITVADAERAVETYISGQRPTLEIAELMEFEHNYYAIVREHDTGMGAMELLVDKTTGGVSPEIGPNMMWNARYGMHARRSSMSMSGPTSQLSETEAVAVAQQWLDEHQAGAQTERHADPFYGYYTIHTLRNGQIEGMLSVHGQTGQVWYHTWHGAFIQMVEEDELEH